MFPVIVHNLPWMIEGSIHKFQRGEIPPARPTLTHTVSIGSIHPFCILPINPNTVHHRSTMLALMHIRHQAHQGSSIKDGLRTLGESDSSGITVYSFDVSLISFEFACFIGLYSYSWLVGRNALKRG